MTVRDTDSERAYMEWWHRSGIGMRENSKQGWLAAVEWLRSLPPPPPADADAIRMADRLESLADRGPDYGGTYRFAMLEAAATIRRLAGTGGWQPITDEQTKEGASFMCWHRLWDCPMWAFYDRNHGTWKLTESMFAVGIPPSHYFPLPEPPIRSDPDTPEGGVK
jgi:hypothetical protein